MKLTKKSVSILIFLIVLVGGLSAWTIESPAVMSIQTQNQLNSSLFSYSNTFSEINISDSSGNYGFRFGLAYPPEIQAGVTTRFDVYAALVAEQLTSSFTRGVSLQVQSASLTIDGKPDTGIKIDSKTQPDLQIFYLEFINTTLPDGKHNLSARLIVSTIDINYIGYVSGASQVVVLNGSFNVTG